MENGFFLCKRMHAYFWAGVFFVSGLFLQSCTDIKTFEVQKLPTDSAQLVIPDVSLVDFGTQLIESRTERTFTVVNVGKNAATNMTGSFSLSAYYYKGGAFPGVGGTCTLTLSSGSSCQVVIVFQPNYQGTFNDSMQVGYFNGTANALMSAPLLTGKSYAGNPGTLDSAFGGGGKAVFSFLAGDDHAETIALQDPKLVIAGAATSGSQTDFALARLNTDGSFDSSFGFNGATLTDFAGLDDEARTIAFQNDGKILVAGRARVGSFYQFALARYSANGMLDSSFGALGRVTTPVGSLDSEAWSMGIQSDNKFVVAGTVFNGTDNDLAVVRYLPGGALDTSFATAGKLIVNVAGGNDVANRLIIQPDGKILVSGYAFNGANDDMFVMRILSNGSADPTFAGTGRALIDFGSTDRGYALSLQVDGKIVVAGSSGTGPINCALARLNASGILDSSFGATGKVSSSFSTGNNELRNVITQVDGSIVVSGYAANGSDEDFLIARYMPSGLVDSAFGSGGSTTVTFGAASDRALGMVQQANGKYLLAGWATVGTELDTALARLWP